MSIDQCDDAFPSLDNDEEQNAHRYRGGNSKDEVED